MGGDRRRRRRSRLRGDRLILGELALALALDTARLPAGAAGVLTPATALGRVAVDRLRAAGMTLSVERLAEAA